MLFNIDNDQVLRYIEIINRTNKYSTGTNTDILNINVTYPKIKLAKSLIDSTILEKKDNYFLNKLFEIELFIANQRGKNNEKNNEIEDDIGKLNEFYKNVIQTDVFSSPNTFTRGVRDYELKFNDLLNKIENRKKEREDIVILKLPDFTEKNGNFNNNTKVEKVKKVIKKEKKEKKEEGEEDVEKVKKVKKVVKKVKKEKKEEGEEGVEDVGDVGEDAGEVDENVDNVDNVDENVDNVDEKVSKVKKVKKVKNTDENVENVKVKKLKKVKDVQDVQDVVDKDNENVGENKEKENLFKFKNTEECSTNKKTAEYYYTKKDILSIISGNKKLKETFPSNYKTLKKQDLCKIIFDKD